VVFPDGPHIFRGHPGDRHALADFVKVSEASKAVPAPVRKMLTALRVGSNDAWSTEGIGSEGKLARNGKDAETTGSVRRSR
jgi:hypothetical protein